MRQKPHWKQRRKQQPGYVKEYAYDEDGLPALEEGFYVVKNEDGTLEYAKEKHIHRIRPNRALVRRIAAEQRRERK